MNESNSVTTGSSAATVLSSGTTLSDNTTQSKRDTKSLKFLSIEDILIGDKVGSKAGQKINGTTGEIPTTEPQTSNTKNGVSEFICADGHNFEPRIFIPSSGNDDAFVHLENSSTPQPIRIIKSQFLYSSGTNILEEDNKDLSDAKTCGRTSETFTQNVESEDTDWWAHPLWKQIYDTRVSHEPQSSLTKVLLPSYLMMSQHVLGARFTFHPGSAEPSSDCPAGGAVYKAETSDELKDIHSVEKILGTDVSESKSPSDASNASLHTATAHTSPALAHHPHKPRRRRQRQAYTITQLNTLEEEFKNNRYLSSEKRESMSQTLGLSENQVKAWFQNRRTKHKKQLTQQINQLSTNHQANQREDRPLGQTFHDPANFVFASTQHPFTALPMVPPIQLHGLSTFLSRGYPASTSYLSLLQKMI